MANETRIMVYMGLCEQGHKYQTLASLEDNDGRSINMNNRIHLYPRNLGACTIGGIYSYELVGDSIKFATKEKVIGIWNNVQDKAAWRTAERVYKLSKQVLKKNSEDNMESILEPIRNLYRYASRDQRALILAEAIRIITR